MANMPTEPSMPRGEESRRVVAPVRTVPVAEMATGSMRPVSADPISPRPSSVQPSSASADPWLRDKLAALQIARLYEPLPLRFQEPLRALQQLLRQSLNGRR